ncbi:3',5'-cyclic AMP phosphodiesterase CpdA [Hamadaea flava]|uniref:Metallophosphoesterase n=1 Tax=Hamadaea flava TaxID=1742688 RepID=A0ABV8M0B7_9ACTN|nr:metallophosphoesterase [Hamadaea flava]MCP2324410.1 3',5'-cyclic AMP phosphodiesterase CpdA [Hamadaea flava]
MIFAHISDTHFDGGERARLRARRVMTWLRGMPLDAILVSGDIADHGTEAEYEEARSELVAEVPVLLLPGNHDVRAAYRKVLGGNGAGDGVDQGAGGEPINSVHRVGRVLFALCDSSIPGRDDGLLAPETLAWLREVLAGADRPVFVGLHHPPIRLRHPLLDSIMLGEPDEFEELIRRSPGVVGVLAGHAHSAVASTFGGRPLLLAPGVVSTTRLPWATPGELTWANTVDRTDPPGVSFHVLDDDGRLATHFRIAPEPA